MIYLHKAFRSSGFKGMSKRQISALVAAYTNRFVREGGEITKCPPAFAYGCDIPVTKRQAIRADR